MKNQNKNIKNKNYLKSTITTIILFCTLLSYHVAFASSITEEKLGDFLNAERRSRNLPELTYSHKLHEAAKMKASDMFSDNYFEHFAPDGTSPWYFIKKTGYVYRSAGENLAMDFYTSEAVHDAWMASPLHRENILSEKYIEYAIYIEDGILDGSDTTLIVEMFGRPDTSTLAKTNQLVNMVLNYLLGK